MAKRAERAQHELAATATASSTLLGQFKEGLLAGEKLGHDLKRMECAYPDQNKREYEMIKHISLRMFDPLALLKPKETASACQSG
jgi:hypothetical protein